MSTTPTYTHAPLDPWERIEHRFESLPSTQTYLHHLEFQPLQLHICTAQTQTAAFGQRHRTWIAPPETGIWCSIGVLSAHALWPWTAMAAVAIAHCFESQYLHPSIKWPNDVLLDDQKCAGILVETAPQGAYQKIIIGIGINLKMHPDLPQGSTALSVHGVIDQHQLTEHIIDSIAHMLDQPNPQWHLEWNTRMAYQHERLLLNQPHQTLEGYIKGITPQGALLFETEQGLQTIYSGQLKRFNTVC
ncbi:MAG: biotin--[acetyl-CoA-carboxylase] ligase [Legionellales bacterium]|nr:biotin--[acetyl-CoA-carboxylase] ligase [Legionellales bacterium]|tara:strand:+ start:1217 stop:1954 length:738 start_codon:yes stop_codon:yes gene_type:complete